MKNNSGICRHFGECGGCSFQDIPYPFQLKEKMEQCRLLLKNLIDEKILEPIIGSPQFFYYRNKMEFTFGFDDRGETVCGLHLRKQKRRVFNLKECKIFSPLTPKIMKTIRNYVQLLGFEPYQNRSHQGFWRNLVLRECKYTNSFLVNLITTSQSSIDEALFIQMFREALTPTRDLTLIHTINDSLSDAVVPEQVRLLYGKPWLEEKIDHYSFRIPPFSFFQVNPYAIRDFYRLLQNIDFLKGHEQVLDIFCGSGPLGVILAGLAGKVTGIELDPEAVKTARKNCSLNGIINSDYIVGDARKILLENRENWREKFSLIVVNPPRSGLSKKIIKRLLEIAPDTILYSSCNPKTFSQQVGGILEHYDLVYARPFDFFPHTPHLELLAIFKKKS